MNEQEIIEGNKLIAEFMGFVKYFPNMTLESDLSNIYYYPKIDRVFDEGFYTSTIEMLCSEGKYNNISIRERNHISEIPFHKSWGLLMPVVEKIENIAIIGKHKLQCRIQSNFCEITEMSNTSYGNSKIEAIYKAVVNFIKKYNIKWKQNN